MRCWCRSHGCRTPAWSPACPACEVTKDGHISLASDPKSNTKEDWSNTLAKETPTTSWSCDKKGGQSKKIRPYLAVNRCMELFISNKVVQSIRLVHSLTERGHLKEWIGVCCAEAGRKFFVPETQGQGSSTELKRIIRPSDIVKTCRDAIDIPSPANPGSCFFKQLQSCQIQDTPFTFFT